ncbi:hypothetical protein [Streptococcus suis]
MTEVVEIIRGLKEVLRQDISTMMIFQCCLIYTVFYSLKYCIDEEHYFLGLCITNIIGIFEMYLFLA